MTVLVATETLLLVLLALLVVGLLRSHAEILRRLEELSGARAPDIRMTPAPEEADIPLSERIDVAGETPFGEAVNVAVAPGRGRTLLAFLSSGCLSCDVLWSGLHHDATGGLPVPARIVVVTKDEDEESPARLRELAPDDVSVIMSTAAWNRFRVAGSPYFILVEPDGQIAGEGTATSWEQLGSLLGDATKDAEPLVHLPEADGHSGIPNGNGVARLDRADAELEQAGIGPGHPSLYSPEALPERDDP